MARRPCTTASSPPWPARCGCATVPPGSRTASGRLHTGATTLHDGLARGLKAIPDPSPSARKAVAQTIGSPVTVQNSLQATAGSYGAGLAPFFLSLALWIGAYVLFLLVRPLSPRALAARSVAFRVAAGRLVAPRPSSARSRPRSSSWWCPRPRHPRRPSVADGRLPDAHVVHLRRDPARAVGVVRRRRQVPRSGPDGASSWSAPAARSRGRPSPRRCTSAPRPAHELRHRRPAPPDVRRVPRPPSSSTPPCSRRTWRVPWCSPP